MAVVWARCGRACTPAAARGSQRPADFNNEIQSGQSEIGRTTSIPSIVSRFGSRRPEVRVLSPRFHQNQESTFLTGGWLLSLWGLGGVVGGTCGWHLGGGPLAQGWWVAPMPPTVGADVGVFSGVLRAECALDSPLNRLEGCLVPVRSPQTQRSSGLVLKSPTEALISGF